MSDKKDWLPSEKNVEDFHLHSKILDVLATEIRELSKKKQEGTLNLTKVRMINRVLKPLKEDILAHVPASIFLDLLDEDSLPNNSDAVLIISQYEAAIREFRQEYHHSMRGEDYKLLTYWSTIERPTGGYDIQEGTVDEDYEEDED